jgi:hypothetical protein
MPEMDERIESHKKRLYKLLLSDRHGFAGATPSDFPLTPGIYAIRAGSEILRAGKTSASLRQRLYTNHLMGSQAGNLPAQLVKGGVVKDLQEAKSWIRANCVASWLEIPDPVERSFMEHFMLSVVQPRFCDKN